MRLIIFIILALNCSSYAQSGRWSKLTMQKSNTAKSAVYLSVEERSVVYYINLARMNPALFESDYLRKYLIKYGITSENSNRWIRSLQAELKSTRPMNPIKPQKDLSSIAHKHAEDMGLAGKSGHNSSSGKSYKNRMKAITKKYYEHFENCQYGLADPLEIVIDLLIDDGEESTPHRRSILNPSVLYIGPAIHPHIVYKFNSVIELGGRLN